MIKKYHVLMTETYSVWYEVEAENKNKAEEKVKLGDYIKQLTNSPEEIQVCTVKEVSK
jgi:hypothetical protein